MNADLEESLKSAVDAYRAALVTVGDAGARAYPPAGDNLKRSLLQLQEALSGNGAPGAFAQTEQRFGQELKAWSDSASRYYQESAEEIKALLLEVAKAAADVGNRDQRYNDHFQGFAERLQGAAKLDSISAMRQSLSTSAVELVGLVNKMTEDGKRTVAQLRGQISAYEERMEAAERLASTDPLTAISNRRVLELRLERRVVEANPFFVVYLDLNEFKQINDTLGHAAGDDLLKQFAGELGHSFRSTDMVGRMGGDEFLMVIDGAVGDVQDRVAQVKKQVNGDYGLPTDTGKRKVAITAAVGIAVWKPGNKVEELLRSADQAMYEDKKRTSAANPAAPSTVKA